MAKAKKLFLLREKRETWRVRIDNKLRHGMCPDCQEEVRWLTCAEAAKELGLSEREVFRSADKGEFHFAESDEGRLLICSNFTGSK